MLTIAIDFDGTIVEHEYPNIGVPVSYAIEYMTAFREMGAKLILWTMRDGKELAEAVQYCSDRGIEFDAVNQSISRWSESPKAEAQIYIDDAAFGCPLNFSKVAHGKRPYVDWTQVGPAVINRLRR